MSVSRSCDICQSHIPENQVSNQARVIHERSLSTVGRGLKTAHLELKITRAVNGKWNDGDVCADCIRKAVADGNMTKNV